MKIEFTLPLEPVPKARPRLGAGRIYTSPKTALFEGRVRRLSREAMNARGLKPTADPLTVTLTFIMPIPQSTSKAQRAELARGMPHHKKPDLDNLIKAVLDGMNERVFKDDHQVWELNAKKIYGEEPSIIVKVETKKA